MVDQQKCVKTYFQPKSLPEAQTIANIRHTMRKLWNDRCESFHCVKSVKIRTRKIPYLDTFHTEQDCQEDLWMSLKYFKILNLFVNQCLFSHLFSNLKESQKGYTL